MSEMATQSNRWSRRRWISLSLSIGLGMTLMLLAVQETTGAERYRRYQSNDGTSVIFLPYLLDNSARFADGADTLTLDNGVVLMY